mmetsp:Transcript_45636/g.108642  ORF Transcript_45636/g.108642 Transcript_45636/m.108642 type:complete len:280 (-) Transcript_45636:1276-2115(-)
MSGALHCRRGSSCDCPVCKEPESIRQLGGSRVLQLVRPVQNEWSCRPAPHALRLVELNTRFQDPFFLHVLQAEWALRSVLAAIFRVAVCTDIARRADTSPILHCARKVARPSFCQLALTNIVERWALHLASPSIGYGIYLHLATAVIGGASHPMAVHANLDRRLLAFDLVARALQSRALSALARGGHDASGSVTKGLAIPIGSARITACNMTEGELATLWKGLPDRAVCHGCPAGRGAYVGILKVPELSLEGLGPAARIALSLPHPSRRASDWARSAGA